MKKHMTRQEEFDILKIVMDKFLLLAMFLLAFGVYKIVNATTDFVLSFSVLLGGVILLIILVIIFVREYEFIKA